MKHQFIVSVFVETDSDSDAAKALAKEKVLSFVDNGLSGLEGIETDVTDYVHFFDKLLPERNCWGDCNCRDCGGR